MQFTLSSYSVHSHHSVYTIITQCTFSSQCLNSHHAVYTLSMQCTLWCRLNVNCNYSQRRDLLEKLRETDRALLRDMVWTMKEQHRSGRLVTDRRSIGGK